MSETLNFNPFQTVKSVRLDQPSQHQAVERQVIVLIVEDERAYQAHLRAVLEKAAGATAMQLLIVDSGDEAIKSALTAAPDVVIMDITLPGLDGLTAAHKIWSANPAVKILFWAQQFREVYARQLQACVPDQAVYGFILKSCSDEDLAYAVTSMVQHDNSYVDSSVRLAMRQSQKSASLSNVEIETLHQLALGLTDKAMAMRSKISLRGVQNRINALYRKILISENQILQQHRAAEMVNLRSRLAFEAIRRGLIDPASLSELDQECGDWIVKTLDITAT
jgi:DNA-binding NarL/FixJ family response regulator